MAAPFAKAGSDPEGSATAGAADAGAAENEPRRWRLRRPEWATPAPAGYRYRVTYSQARSEIRIKRIRRVPDTRHDQHRMLAEVMSRQTILPKARVSVTSNHPVTGNPTGYRIKFEPTFKAGSDEVQRAISDALIKQVGETENAPDETDDTGRVVPKRRWATRWNAQAGTVELWLKESIPTRILHPVAPFSELGDGDRLHIPYATGENGKVAYWNVSSNSSGPHSLWVGRTGGGKTTLLVTLITEAVRRGIPVIGVDPKMIELAPMVGFPGVLSVIDDPMEAARLVRALAIETKQGRNTYMKRTRTRAKDMPLVIVIIDEFFVLSGMWTELIKNGTKEQKEEIKYLNPFAAVSEIVVLARSAGIRLAVGVQRPDAQIFGPASGNTRDNFNTRGSMMRMSQDGSLMMWDDARVGRQLDVAFPGRAMVSDEDGNPMQAQVWLTPDCDPHPDARARLDPTERSLVEALTPAPHDAPEIDCYSQEFQDFLTAQRMQQATALHQPAREPVRIGNTNLDDLDDAIPAKSVTAGMYVQVPAPSGEGLISAHVRDVAITTPGADTPGGVTLHVEIPAGTHGSRQKLLEQHFSLYESVFLGYADLDEEAV